MTVEIHKYKNKWWFWDEAWSHRVGPYETREEAEKKLKVYYSFLGSSPSNSKSDITKD